MSTEHVTIAGRPVGVTAEEFAQYIRDHGKTVRHYDLLPEPRSVDADLIRATRSPYMGSRISATQAEWFIERSKTAPWDDVPTDASLIDADPLEVGGLYDSAIAIYDHFRNDAPSGVAVAKLSKVLHLMHPALVPILDSKLLSVYRGTAQEAALRVVHHRPELRSQRRMYWAAIREDLVASKPRLDAVRDELTASEEPLVREAADRLSDLRLLDMVTWKQ